METLFTSLSAAHSLHAQRGTSMHKKKKSLHSTALVGNKFAHHSTFGSPTTQHATSMHVVPPIRVLKSARPALYILSVECNNHYTNTKFASQHSTTFAQQRYDTSSLLVDQTFPHRHTRSPHSSSSIFSLWIHQKSTSVWYTEPQPHSSKALSVTAILPWPPRSRHVAARHRPRSHRRRTSSPRRRLCPTSLS